MKISPGSKRRVVFFKPYRTGNEIKYVSHLFQTNADLSGDGFFTKKIHTLLEKKFKTSKVLLTTSGTTALELAAALLNLNPGDEVIVPSFTFSSTANAFLINGSKVVFADIDPLTLNIDPLEIEKKITKRTKAVCVVHYAGVACKMDEIMKLAKKYKLKVIEDAAQAIESKYKDRYLGTIGDFGCLSFHDTKNITSGEGGALLINVKKQHIIDQAEIVREKGTNRNKFFRGQVDKYTWLRRGSSYLPSDILAAVLFAQLEKLNQIQRMRHRAYDTYAKLLQPYEKKGLFQIPHIPTYAKHNAHIFYLLFKNEKTRNIVMDKLKKQGIDAYFHYIPLHSSPFGKTFGYKKGDLRITERTSGCLLRLPLFAEIKTKDIKYVVKTVINSINEL